MTDSEMIDWLEKFVRGEPLTLWDGYGEFPGNRGSGAYRLGRTERCAMLLSRPLELIPRSDDERRDESTASNMGMPLSSDRLVA